MYVTYFYFVGGICIPAAFIGAIEGKLFHLAHDVFKSYNLTPETEFHASFIYQGKGPFKGKPAEERIDLILKLADVLADTSIKRVFVEIMTTRIKYGIDPGETAFIVFGNRFRTC